MTTLERYTQTAILNTKDSLTFDIEVWADTDSDNPRDWITEGPVYFYVYSWDRTNWNIALDELTDSVTDSSAGEVVRHFIYRFSVKESESILRAFALWRALNIAERSHWQLLDGSGHGYTQGDYHEYYALVDTRELPDSVSAEQYVRQENDVYSTWRYGGVSGVTVSLNGTVIETRADFYTSKARDEFIQETINDHVESLVHEANSHTAGIVGVI